LAQGFCGHSGGCCGGGHAAGAHASMPLGWCLLEVARQQQPLQRGHGRWCDDKRWSATAATQEVWIRRGATRNPAVVCRKGALQCQAELQVLSTCVASSADTRKACARAKGLVASA